MTYRPTKGFFFQKSLKTVVNISTKAIEGKRWLGCMAPVKYSTLDVKTPPRKLVKS